MDGIFPYRSRIQLTDRPFIGLRRVGSPDQFAEISYGIVFFQDSRDNGAAAHEIDQFAIEGPCLMNGIKFAGFLL